MPAGTKCGEPRQWHPAPEADQRRPVSIQYVGPEDKREYPKTDSGLELGVVGHGSIHNVKLYDAAELTKGRKPDFRPLGKRDRERIEQYKQTLSGKAKS